MTVLHHRGRLVVLAVYWVVICVATHWPAELRPLEEHYLDKVVHFFAYGTLAWLMAWAWRHRVAEQGWRFVIGMWAIAAAYGAVDEWLQIPVGRHCELLDWLADVTGAALALCLFTWLVRSHESAADAPATRQT